MRHHHHSSAPAVAAALVGAGAAALVGYLVHKENTEGVYALHEELHAVVQRDDARFSALNEGVARNFMGAAAGQQHLAEAFNTFVDEFREFKTYLLPPRAQPGGEEPPA